MKYILITSAFVLGLAAAPVLANEAHHSSDSATEQSASSANVKPGAGMGMMEMHDGMQQHMDKMYAIMEETQQAKSDKERHSLMREHKQEMHKAMDRMQGMMNKHSMMMDMEGC